MNCRTGSKAARLLGEISLFRSEGRIVLAQNLVEVLPRTRGEVNFNVLLLAKLFESRYPSDRRFPCVSQDGGH